MFGRVVGISSLVFLVLLYLLCEDMLLPIPAIPAVPPIRWGDTGGDTLTHFQVTVPTEVISDMKARIRSDLARLPPPLEDSMFEYGVNTEFLAEIGQYWLEEFDWETQEAMINNIPQFLTNIDGLHIHFLHVKPQQTAGKKILPLLLVHGWPGSVVEFLDIIPLLTAGDEDYAFEVIAPSLPGYGFSSAPTKQGFDLLQAAKIFKSLMLRLGHQQFYCQGGDWGSLITTTLATLYPGQVLGLHVNMGGVISPGGTIKNLLTLVPGMKYLIVDQDDWDKTDNMGNHFLQLLRESGYMHLQATKPDTLGVGLNASPLGLAGYILEKFSTWTNPKLVGEKSGGLGESFPISMDRLLTNIMIYWVTGTITSSMRFYKENLPLSQDIDRIPLTMPVGYADFPQELYRAPEFMIRGKFRNLVQYSRMPRGGHFAAMEVPELLAENLFHFVRKAEENIRNKQEL